MLLGVSCNEKDPLSKAFGKDNLIPWSIEEGDAKELSPLERLERLESMGYKQYAYENNSKHISAMELEWRLARDKGINIKAVSLHINLKNERPNKLNYQSEIVFKNLKKVGLQTQIWVGFESVYFENVSKNEALKQSVNMISYLSKRAKKLGCKIALYSDKGWLGKPENQLRIINALSDENLGVVFNFQHIYGDLDNYRKKLKDLLPYLWCVNLNGVKRKGSKVIVIGKGKKEMDMLEYLLSLKYKGPFGLLGNVKVGGS